MAFPKRQSKLRRDDEIPPLVWPGGAAALLGDRD
jgi:hypothetical protein